MSDPALKYESIRKTETIKKARSLLATFNDGVNNADTSQMKTYRALAQVVAPAMCRHIIKQDEANILKALNNNICPDCDGVAFVVADYKDGQPVKMRCAMCSSAFATRLPHFVERI